MMNITYIHHSGFLVETASCYYLFDYYKGDLPALKTDKHVIVFASHNHQDHYNPQVFQLLQEQGMEHITALLGKDIPSSKYPSGIEGLQCIKASAHQTYSPGPDTAVKTLLSTDAGVAFLVVCPEGILYHGGDLNDWVWAEESEQYNRQMTGSYRHEIDLLKEMLDGACLDVAFLPLDPRQEKDCANGLLYFLKKLDVRKVYPMHYWEHPQIIEKFLAEYPEYKSVVQNTEKPLEKEWNKHL